MKITRKQLLTLVENYLLEQEDTENKDDEVVSDVEGDDAANDAEQKTDDEASSEKINGIDIKNTKSFNIEIDDKVHEVEFIQDPNDSEKVQYKVNNEILSNKTLQNFVTLAALNLLGQNEDDHPVMHKILQLDKNFKNYSLTRAKEMVKQKRETDRTGFTLDDIRDALGL